MFEIVVIGGGPAGSTLAALAAKRGRRVLLLEKERFPRFHIGESLLPMSVPVFEKLGVKATLDAHFLKKYAAEFVTANGSLTRRYPFSESLIDGPSFAYEVERAPFDDMLLENAAACGADVRQGVEATAFTTASNGVEVVTRNASGHEERIRGKVLVDASGQRSLVASRLGLRRMDRDLKNFAVFSHFTGAHRHSGEREGDITVVLDEVGWWWVIPLREDKTSVGYVAPSRSLAGQKPNEDYFKRRIESTPYLVERLAGARRVAEVRTISDYSYTSRAFAGDGWVLVGDAAAFIDPVFSTGVCLGMGEALRAADAIERALDSGAAPRRAFRDYERFVARAVETYSGFVKGFYTPEFVELLMNPSDSFELRRGITALLAGHALGNFDVVWRSWLFRSLARMNRVMELVPRIPERRSERD